MTRLVPQTLVCLLLLATTLQAAAWQRIQVAADAQPAIQSAAKILAAKLNLPVTNNAPQKGDILLTVASQPAKTDGYKITFANGTATIRGDLPVKSGFAADSRRLDRPQKTMVCPINSPL